jgi:hypothetical protein
MSSFQHPNRSCRNQETPGHHREDCGTCPRPVDRLCQESSDRRNPHEGRANHAEHDDRPTGSGRGCKRGTGSENCRGRDGPEGVQRSRIPAPCVRGRRVAARDRGDDIFDNRDADQAQRDQENAGPDQGTARVLLDQPTAARGCGQGSIAALSRRMQLRSPVPDMPPAAPPDALQIERMAIDTLGPGVAAARAGRADGLTPSRDRIHDSHCAGAAVNLRRLLARLAKSGSRRIEAYVADRVGETVRRR